MMKMTNFENRTWTAAILKIIISETRIV